MKSNYLIRSIGDIFSLQGKTYQVVERPDCTSCYNCAFEDNCRQFVDYTGVCGAAYRSDHKPVNFKQINNMNEVKITVPEGMEIDKETSTFECIKFKPSRILSWSQYREKNPHCENKIIDACEAIKPYFCSKEILRFYALFQLRLIHNTWVIHPITKHDVYVPYKQDKIWRVRARATSHSDLTNWLVFPSEEMCQDFIFYFKELLDQTI